MTFGSLFAGIGGFDLGFERAGMECKWQVEIDDYATRVLEKHWPNVRRHRDIRTFPEGNAADWKVDVVCGGFPCQDISYAGKGAGLAGERSGLFYEAMRVIREVEPRYVVLENVAALLTRGLDQVLGTLASFGFDAEWHCIPAAAVGAPHIRDRVFVLAYAYESFASEGRIQRSGQFMRTGCNHGENPGGVLADCSRTMQQATAIRSDGNKLRWVQEQLRGSGRWATEPAVGRVADGIPNRTHRLRGLGNAVVPQVAEWIGRRLMEHELKEPACPSPS